MLSGQHTHQLEEFEECMEKVRVRDLLQPSASDRSQKPAQESGPVSRERPAFIIKHRATQCGLVSRRSGEMEDVSANLI